MPQQPINTASVSNRRRTRRHQVSSYVRAECRKGNLGLGRNVALKALDVSESGARLIVSALLVLGQDVELLLSGPGAPKALKRIAKVVWTVPLADGNHCIGVIFEKHLRYNELLRFARACG